jgi:hypothetical protein
VLRSWLRFLSRLAQTLDQLSFAFNMDITLRCRNTMAGWIIVKLGMIADDCTMRIRLLAPVALPAHQMVASLPA